MDKKNIIIIAVILVVVLALVFFGSRQEPVVDREIFTAEESREIAENWILNNSPTYLFDGFNLEFVSENELLAGKIYSFVFAFDSRAAGYGDRSDQMLAQVITPHMIEVVVEEGEVVSAITDQAFDEIKGEMIEEAMPDELEMIDISVYFVRVIDGQESLAEVVRPVPYTVETARAAMEELLKGPMPDEEEQGYSTAINEGTELQDIRIENNIAFVDFNEELQEGVAGSAWVTMIRSQISTTLTQFDTVNDVVISINGETEGILEP